VDTVNDLKLCESTLKVQQLARRLNELRANEKPQELWQALGEIHRHSQLAMYRLMDLGI
jgi:hypothetical protein